MAVPGVIIRFSPSEMVCVPENLRLPVPVTFRASGSVVDSSQARTGGLPSRSKHFSSGYPTLERGMLGGSMGRTVLAHDIYER
ncbi:MAG: hypothetical protein ACOCVQ_02225, partial [Bacillota bacterium]